MQQFHNLAWTMAQDPAFQSCTVIRISYLFPMPQRVFDHNSLYFHCHKLARQSFDLSGQLSNALFSLIFATT